MNAALSPLRQSWAMQTQSPAASGGGSSYTTVYQDRREYSALDSDSDEDEQLGQVTEWSEYMAGHQRMRAAQTSRLQKEWRESSSGRDSTTSQREHTRDGEGGGASDFARDELEIRQERVEMCGENTYGVTRGIKGSSTVVVSTSPCSDARLQAGEMAEIEAMEGRIKDLTATHSREMAQANDRSDELQRQNAYLESRVSELEGDLEERMSTETGQVASLNRRISDMRSSHRENMAAAAEEFATLNNRLMEKDEETRALVAAHEEAMRAKEAEISHLKGLLSQLEMEHRGSRQSTGVQQQQHRQQEEEAAAAVAAAVAAAIKSEPSRASSVHGTSETATCESETPRTSFSVERGLSVISEGRTSTGGSGTGASNSHRAKGGILRLPWKDRRSKARRTQSLSGADAAISAASSEQASLGAPGDCVDLDAVSGDNESNGLQQNRPPKSAATGKPGAAPAGGGSSERKMKRPLWRTFSRSLSIDAHSSSSSSAGQRKEPESVPQGDASACGGATRSVSGDTSASDQVDKVASGSSGPKGDDLAGNDHDSAARSGENFAGELSDATAALSCFSSGSSCPPSGSSSPHGQQDASKTPPKPVTSAGRSGAYSDDSGAASSSSTSSPSRVDDGLEDGEAPTNPPPPGGIESEAMKRESMASKALAAAARAEAEAREKALKALDLLKLAHARVREVEARAEKAMREAEKIAAEARSAEARAVERENEARKAQVAALEQEEKAKATGLRAREQVHSAKARAALAEQHLMNARTKTLSRVRSEAEELKHLPVSSMVAGGGFHRPNGVSHASQK